MANPSAVSGFQQGLFGTLDFLQRRRGQQEASDYRKQQFEFQKEDRGIADAELTRRHGREDVQDASLADDRVYAKATRKAPEMVQAGYARDEETGGLNLKTATVNLADATRKLDQAPTNAQAARGIEQTLEQGELGNKKSRLDIATSGEALKTAKFTQAQKEAEPVIEEFAYLLKNSPDAITDSNFQRLAKASPAFHLGIASIVDPEWRAASDRITTAMSNGQIEDPELIPSWNKILSEKLNEHAGEKTSAAFERPNGMGGIIKVPKGSLINERELIGVKPGKGGVYPILRVNFTAPDGQSGTYLAPRTKGGKANGSTDPVFVTNEEIASFAIGSNKLAKELSSDPKVNARMRAWVAGNSKQKEVKYDVAEIITGYDAFDEKPIRSSVQTVNGQVPKGAKPITLDSTKPATQAPPRALEALKSNPSAQMKSQFQVKYGFLPEGL